MDLMTAIQLVMKKSLAHDGFIRGLPRPLKSMLHSCILAEDCNQPDCTKLVKALCADHNVHLVTVSSAKKPSAHGQCCGLSPIDSRQSI